MYTSFQLDKAQFTSHRLRYAENLDPTSSIPKNLLSKFTVDKSASHPSNNHTYSADTGFLGTDKAAGAVNHLARGNLYHSSATSNNAENSEGAKEPSSSLEKTHEIFQQTSTLLEPKSNLSQIENFLIERTFVVRCKANNKSVEASLHHQEEWGNYQRLDFILHAAWNDFYSNRGKAHQEIIKKVLLDWYDQNKESHLLPTIEEKAQLMQKTGLDLSKLDNWFYYLRLREAIRVKNPSSNNIFILSDTSFEFTHLMNKVKINCYLYGIELRSENKVSFFISNEDWRNFTTSIHKDFHFISPPWSSFKIATGPRVVFDWVLEHIKNPFPTIEEKTTLELNSGLSSEQLDNWFSNLRSKFFIRKIALTEKDKKEPLVRTGKTVLSQWVSTHKNKPYPTLDEKLALVQESGLSIEQVNVWFINTRKRLRKDAKKALLADQVANIEPLKAPQLQESQLGKRKNSPSSSLEELQLEERSASKKVATVEYPKSSKEIPRYEVQDMQSLPEEESDVLVFMNFVKIIASKF